MAETDPVRIVVEIVDQFSDELAELRGQLEELDLKDLDVDLDIEDDGDIESVKAQLQALRERLEAELDIDIDDSDFARAMGMKAMLEDDVTVGVDFDQRGLDIGADPEAFEGLREATRVSLEDKIPAHPESFGGLGARGTADAMFDDSAVRDFTESIHESTRAAREFESETDFRFGDFLGRERGSEKFRAMFDRDRGGGFDGPLGGALGDAGIFGGGRGRRRHPARQAGRAVGKMATQFDNLGRKLLRYRPSIMDWWNILALLIPVLITMVGLVIGLAAAFVALGAAAATIAGVGLLAWGDSMSESLQNLQKEAKQLGSALFDVLQPAAEQFQPMQEDAMEALPSMVADLVGPMQRLTVFGDELGAMGKGFVDWMEDGINAAADLNEEIGQILIRFGAGLGNFLIDLLTTMVKEVHRNQNAYADLAAILVDALVIIFNLVKSVGFLIAQFRGFFDVLALLTSLMSSEWAVGILMFISLVVLLETAIATAVGTLSALAGASLAGWAASVFPYLTKAIAMMWQFVAAANTAWGSLARLLALTGVGLALVVGSTAAIEGAVSNSVGNPGGGRRGRFAQSGGNTFITVEGDVEKKQMDRLLDKVPGETSTEMNMQEGIEGPG